MLRRIRDELEVKGEERTTNLESVAESLRTNGKLAHLSKTEFAMRS